MEGVETGEAVADVAEVVGACASMQALAVGRRCLLMIEPMHRPTSEASVPWES